MRFPRKVELWGSIEGNDAGLHRRSSQNEDIALKIVILIPCNIHIFHREREVTVQLLISFSESHVDSYVTSF